MYAKIYNFKFNGVAEAKVAASFISMPQQIDRCQQYALAEHFHWQMRKPVNSDKI